ncbi:PilZ domain-containing protein [Sulfurospirillum barnesii]|uniref:PilZ domain-containing protein n=1 Tax=Sulfurospirillum barnesii (strain ATCC 700032 / DSM 10660 / SES-3) TaxID=760154 RepID=I3XU45_SULBS|nr:PilZ domain-containing protein [Sulfurospirillum barnesii]AFL67469.1 PilZ domain-containing protein [Sulfurospirillum barnesii SES-3]
METEAIFQQEKEHFLLHSALFLEEFESDFRAYFVLVAKEYDNSIDEEEISAIAKTTYATVFESDEKIKKLKQTLLSVMQKDRLKLTCVLTRSMLYFMEKYRVFCKERQSVAYLDVLCACVYRFHEICEKTTSQAPSFIHFGQSGDVLFSHTNSILETFQTMKEAGEKVVFLNLYKGVPISSEARIVSIDHESVTFTSEGELQAIAIKLDNNAFIVKNAYFTKHIKADVVSYNFKSNTVKLTNFTYLMAMPALQRESIRVHPDILATVYMHHHNAQTSGRLYDISMNGLGIVSNENHGIFIGAKVKIEFELNELSQDRKIEVEGEVINIIEYNTSYRYCMRIFPDSFMRQKISHYITKREEEILEELKKELQEYML